jgi:hypothetical protein
VRRPKPPFRDIVDAHVVIGWLADLPEPAEPLPEPIRVQYPKAPKARRRGANPGAKRPLTRGSHQLTD